MNRKYPTFLLTWFNKFPRVPSPGDYLHLKEFLKCKCGLYWKQSLTTPQGNIIVAYRTSNHRFAIKTRWWLTIHIFTNYNRLCHFSIIIAKLRHTLC